VTFKPTQSTIVFSVSRPGELAPEYRVHHTRAGRFGRFGETEVAEAARELALAFAEKGAHGSALDPLHLLEAGPTTFFGRSPRMSLNSSNQGQARAAVP
jgi:hypothetical protein